MKAIIEKRKDDYVVMFPNERCETEPVNSLSAAIDIVGLYDRAGLDEDGVLKLVGLTSDVFNFNDLGDLLNFMELELTVALKAECKQKNKDGATIIRLTSARNYVAKALELVRGIGEMT